MVIGKKNNKMLLILCFAIAFTSVITLIFLCSNNSKSVSRKIYEQLTKEYKDNGFCKDVNLADYTDFDWDEVFVFYYCDKKSIEKYLGMLPDFNETDPQNSGGILFIKKKRVIKNEFYYFDFDELPINTKVVFYPRKQFSSVEDRMILLSKDNAVFSVERFKIGYKKGFNLSPKFENG